MKHKKENFPFFGLIYVLSILAVIVVGISFSNILYFWIEDIYALPPSSPFPFGQEYATSIACQLVAVVVFFVCFAYTLRAYICCPELQDKPPMRRLFLKIMLFLSMLIFLGYIIGVISGYFSGESDFPSLLKVFVVMGVTAFGGLFFFFEARPSTTRMYHSSVVLIAIISTVISVVLTLIYAPPSVLQKVQRDRERINFIQKISAHVENFYRENDTLPKTLRPEFLSSWHDDTHTAEDPEKEFSYTPKDDHNFEICSVFESNPNDGRRIYRHDVHKSKGKNCRIYTVKKQKDGDTTMILQPIYIEQGKEKTHAGGLS